MTYPDNKKNSTFIIAEAGVNHNGDYSLAKKLIDAAVRSNVDAIKFQTFKVDNLVAESAPKATYQKMLTPENESQKQMLKALEIPFSLQLKLHEYAKTKGILFLSTPFDAEKLRSGRPAAAKKLIDDSKHPAYRGLL